MSTKTKLRLMLDAGEVRRFHTNRVIKDRTVGQHTFNIFVLADAYYHGMVPHRLMKAILYHDMHEGITGDMPWPIKQQYPELCAIETEVDKEYGLNVVLPDDQAQLLKLLDMLEFYLYMLDERRLGNTNNSVEFSRAHRVVTDIKLPDKWHDFLQQVIQEVC